VLGEDADRLLVDGDAAVLVVLEGYSASVVTI